MTGKVQMNVRVDKTLRDKVDDWCENSDYNKTDLITTAIMEFFATRESVDITDTANADYAIIELAITKAMLDEKNAYITRLESQLDVKDGQIFAANEVTRTHTTQLEALVNVLKINLPNLHPIHVIAPVVSELNTGHEDEHDNQIDIQYTCADSIPADAPDAPIESPDVKPAPSLSSHRVSMDEVCRQERPPLLVRVRDKVSEIRNRNFGKTQL